MILNKDDLSIFNEFFFFWFSKVYLCEWRKSIPFKSSLESRWNIEQKQTHYYDEIRGFSLSTYSEISRIESNYTILRDVKGDEEKGHGMFFFLPEFDAMESVALLANEKCNPQDLVLNIQILKIIPVDSRDPLDGE